MGTLWKDNPETTILTAVVDEVAKVNDSVPFASQKTRWSVVREWLDGQITKLEKQA
jgi:hypothetical protein